MTAFFAFYWRGLRALEVAEIALGVTLFAAIVVSIGAQVVSRYLFGMPLIWVEEVATYSFIWATFLGASVGLKRGQHIEIGTFVGGLSPRRRAVVRVVAQLLVLTLLLVLARQAVTVMGVEGRSSTISLPIQLPRSLFYSLPLFVAMASMAVTTLYFLLAELYLVATGVAVPHRPLDEPDELQEPEEAAP